MDYRTEIKNMYKRILEREADEEGIQTYTTFLQKKSLNDLEKILINSFEYRNKKKKQIVPNPIPQPIEKKKLTMKPNESHIVGIFLHVGNLEIMKEMQSVILTIQSCCKCEIFLSTLHKIRVKKLPMNMRNAHIIPCENRGMDIGGFCKCVEYIERKKIKVDYILKLHTKSSKEWRDELYLPLCESTDIVNTVLWMFETDDRLGVVGAPNHICTIQNANYNLIKKKLQDIGKESEFILYDIDFENMEKYTFDPDFYVTYHADMVRNNVKAEDAWTHWDKNGRFEHERVICNDMIKTIGNNMQYVAGTMFWIRYSTLSKFSKYLIEDYENLEEGRLFNNIETHTHSWEYLFGIIPQIDGYKIAPSICYKLIDIGIFVPEMPKEPICGGSRTIQVYINELCKEYNVKIFVFGSTKNVTYEISDLTKRIQNFNELDHKYTVHNVDEFDTSTEYLALIATGWQTTDIVENAINTRNKVHIIQDYECQFFDDPQFFKRAEQTYFKMNTYDLRVCVGKYMSYFLYRKYNLVVTPIEFGINKSIFNFQNLRRKPQIILTYMPSKNRRNAALIKDIYETIKAEYEVIVIGENNTDLPSNSYCQKELAFLYNESKVGIVFSMSNPSRMGFEMGACGLPVIEYDSENNKFDLPNCFYKITEKADAVDIIQKLMKLTFQEYQHIVEKTTRACSFRDISQEKVDFVNQIKNYIC